MRGLCGHFGSQRPYPQILKTPRSACPPTPHFPNNANAWNLKDFAMILVPAAPPPHFQYHANTLNSSIFNDSGANRPSHPIPKGMQMHQIHVICNDSCDRPLPHFPNQATALNSSDFQRFANRPPPHFQNQVSATDFVDFYDLELQ